MAKATVAPPRADGAVERSASRSEMHGGKKRVREISTKRAKGGGHTVTHHYDNGGMGPYHQSEDHVFGAGEGMKHVAHYIRHAGIKGVKPMATEPDGDEGAEE